MMKLKPILFWLFLANISCEQVYEISLPEENTRLAVTSLFGPGTDTSQLIHIYTSYPTLENRDPYNQIVKDAIVRIYEDDLLVEETQYIDATDYLDFINISPFYEGFYVIDEIEPIVGKNYTLEVEVEGFEKLYSTTSIPEKVSMIRAEIYPEVITGLDNVTNGEALEGKIVFQDPPGENYYLLKLNVMVTQEDGVENIHETAQLIIDNVELGFDNVDQSRFEFSFRDVVFENEIYEINFLVANARLITEIKEYGFFYGTEKVEVSIILQNLAAETYHYLISTNLQKEIANDPFAQPVQIQSNIANGLGIFGGINQDHKRLDIADILNAERD